MRKSISFISVICLLLMAAMPLSAQDARQRKTETIVQDVLALMTQMTDRQIELVEQVLRCMLKFSVEGNKNA